MKKWTIMKRKFFFKIPFEIWRRQWHPTPVLLPGKSHGWRRLGGCSPWVAKSRTRLSDFTFTFHFPALEKEMATHSSVLAWRISGTAEPGGLPSMGLHRVGHNWSDLVAAFEIASKRKKFPRNKLNKAGQGLYSENYNTLIKETEGDTKKCKNILRS